jgi:hypothetical protein
MSNLDDKLERDKAIKFHIAKWIKNQLAKQKALLLSKKNLKKPGKDFDST